MLSEIDLSNNKKESNGGVRERERVLWLLLSSPSSFFALSPSFCFSPKILSLPHPTSSFAVGHALPSSPGPRAAAPARTPPDRILATTCYIYPFLDSVQYGRYIVAQFPAFQFLLLPLVLAIHLFRSSPLNGFLLFLTLYFAVVSNPSFSRYIRLNTMQAIILDVLLIFPNLLERILNPRRGLALDLLQSVDSTIFFFLLLSLTVEFEGMRGRWRRGGTRGWRGET